MIRTNIKQFINDKNINEQIWTFCDFSIVKYWNLEEKKVAKKAKTQNGICRSTLYSYYIKKNKCI